MTRTTVAVAADYADAMLVARLWKHLLVLLLILCLLIQLAIFFFVKFGYSAHLTVLHPSSTQPVATTHDFTPGLIFLTNLVDFVAIVSVVVLAVILLLIVGIMLVGRLVGVSHVTSAFIWCVVLGALLFPWQSLWNYPIAGTIQTVGTEEERVEVGPRYGFPGVLYTWPELRHRYDFPNTFSYNGVLGWGRFVVWPVIALIILGSVQVRSTRGLRFALGEAELQVASTTTVVTPPPGTV